MKPLPDPATCDEATLARFARDLGVTRREDEALDAWRARVVAAFNDDDAVNAAAPTPPTGFALGGFKLGA